MAQPGLREANIGIIVALLAGGLQVFGIYLRTRVIRAQDVMLSMAIKAGSTSNVFQVGFPKKIGQSVGIIHVSAQNIGGDAVFVHNGLIGMAITAYLNSGCTEIRSTRTADQMRSMAAGTGGYIWVGVSLQGCPMYTAFVGGVFCQVAFFTYIRNTLAGDQADIMSAVAIRTKRGITIALQHDAGMSAIGCGFKNFHMTFLAGSVHFQRNGTCIHIR
ncbi:MAG TPA: hypothetical protein DIS70_08965 [Anaerolineae bacterium]|nr:hypothetical protein [Anaerolineae bacterium]